MRARRLLVVSTEPPPTSSGLGTVWSKLVMGSVCPEFSIEFLGPDPVLCSNHGSSGLPAVSRLHGLGPPPLSRVSSLRRNSGPAPQRLAWTIVRLPFAMFERLTGRDLYGEWIQREVGARLRKVLRENEFDAVAVMATSLGLAEAVRRVCDQGSIPFVLVIGDPIGHRDENGGFIPDRPDLQASLLRGAAAFVTTESAFSRYYGKAFPIRSERVAFFQDSYLPSGAISELPPVVHLPAAALFHWGQVDPWRPLGTLLSGISEVNRLRRREGREPLGLAVMGTIVDQRARAAAIASLGERFIQLAPRPYLEARAIARTASHFVVVVSERHRDNIPSKLIDSLAYCRPIVLLAHPDSAAADLVRELGVGVVADVRDGSSVAAALHQVELDCDRIRAAFSDAHLARAWSYPWIGQRFRLQLFTALGWNGGGLTAC